jgi:signal transduction histidine kinase
MAEEDSSTRPPLRTLLVEDNPNDAELVLMELRRAGREPIARRVETAAQMIAALAENTWDVIISDYSLATFDAPAAFSLVRERNLDIPFIVVSGTAGEDKAVDAMRAGVHDFLFKGQLRRLVAAIERELREATFRAERRKIQEQLLISDRMASVGTIAAGIAHEINNPLAVVLWNLELLRDDLAGAAAAPDSRRLVAEAMDAGERVRGIVADMRTLSRTPASRSAPVDLTRAIDRALQIAAGTVKHRARIVRDYQPVPTVLADESKLVQVLINLLTNAADAIPPDRHGDGCITVGTRTTEDGKVVAWVRDDGVGIPSDIRDRVFDPFFTTKDVGVGTGLGLSISHNLVTSMQGRLELASEPGRGTTASVILEAAAADEPARRSSETIPALKARRKARILVIDDEPAIGTVAARLLGRNHDVQAVTSGAAALARLEGGQRFDLILCDVLMPGMTGLDVHARLRASYSDQADRVVFMTGGVSQESRDAAARLSATVLDKPLNARALSAFIDDFLASRGGQERAA